MLHAAHHADLPHPILEPGRPVRSEAAAEVLALIGKLIDAEPPVLAGPQFFLEFTGADGTQRGRQNTASSPADGTCPPAVTVTP